MPICGCCCCCISDCGAFGFSNEKSLEYCTRTLRLGAVMSEAAGAGLPPPFTPSPFVVVMVSLRPCGNPAEPARGCGLSQAIDPNKDGAARAFHRLEEAEFGTTLHS